MLAEYLRKGFAMDDERLKNPDGRPDYFDEMLARIRDIRTSEKRFYQKVRDLFALAADYDKTDQATQQFFATVQNLLLYAVTQHTAAEIILARANPAAPHFGLLTWKGAQVRKQGPEVVHEGADVVGGVRVGFVVATEVGGDDTVARGERLQLVAPRVPHLGKAVEEEHGVAGAGLRVVHADAVHVRELVAQVVGE